MLEGARFKDEIVSFEIFLRFNTNFLKTLKINFIGEVIKTLKKNQVWNSTLENSFCWDSKEKKNEKVWKF